MNRFLHVKVHYKNIKFIFGASKHDEYTNATFGDVNIFDTLKQALQKLTIKIWTEIFS